MSKTSSAKTDVAFVGIGEVEDEELFMSRRVMKDEELQVARILLDLAAGLYGSVKDTTPLLLRRRSNSAGISASWGRKKRRSEPLPPPPGRGVGVGASVEGRYSKSPTSPLEFKNARISVTTNSSTSKASVKAILQKEHDKLTKQRESLLEDVAKVESRRRELMAENLLLKQKRRQKFQKFQSVGEERGSPNHHSYEMAVIQAAGPSQIFEGFQHQNHHQLLLQQAEVVPTRIPDLNISAEEYAAMAMEWSVGVEEYQYYYYNNNNNNIIIIDNHLHHNSNGINSMSTMSNRMVAKERRRNRVEMMIQKRRGSAAKAALGNR